MIAPDVVVVGGGPVGLAAAIAIRRQGFRVLVAERARPPIDKPCGEGVMPEGVVALSRLGVLCDAPALPFRGIRFTEAGCSAEGLFRENCGLGIRRTLLHERLIDRAAEAGVILHWGEPVRLIQHSGVYIGGAKMPCQWIIGADGRESSVRRWAGFCSPSKMPIRIGLRQHFRIAPWTDLVEVHWHDRGQMVITPVAPDEICVSLLANDARSRAAELLTLYPEVKRRLARVQVSGPVRGAICSASVMRSVVRHRVALIGDAAGTMDAITGEGLSLGFRQAVVLADALASDNIQKYEQSHRRLRWPHNLMSKLILTIGGRTRLRRRMLKALATQPSLLSFALAVHTGVLPITAVPLGSMAGFLRRLVTNGSLMEQMPDVQ
jgi:2-polyprenyl-6-methoxyphenol hydroxylase-like FAD-dependent oxidoreductase